jgi:hypothetical protein
MSEPSGNPPKGRSLRFFIWLAVVSWAIGTAVASLDCLHEADNWRYQFDYLHIFGKALIYSASLMVVFSICFLTRAQMKRAFSWLFSWRMVKRALKALAVLLCLAAILFVEENWRGRRAWDAYREELEAKGEHLDFDYFIPPPVPDEQNFAFTPVVASCYSQVLDREGHRIDPPNTNVVNRLKMELYRTWLETGTNMLLGNWQKGRLTALSAWQTYYRTSFKTNQMVPGAPLLPETVVLRTKDTNDPYESIVYALGTNDFPVSTQPQSPAADVLLALSKYDSVIEELRQASQMPSSRFPLNYATNNPARIIYPHLASLKSCALVLRLRAVAELENGKPDMALSDVRLMLYLAGSIRNEPQQWPLSVRMFLTDSALQPIWEGLARQQWSNDELIALEQELAVLDALKDYEFGVRSEMAWNLKFIEYLRIERMANSINDWNDHNMWGPTLIYRLLPGGWFYLNARAMARGYEAALPTSAELEHRIISPEISNRFGRSLGLGNRRHLIPDNFFVLSMVPALDREAINCARTQAAIDMARVACALERYRQSQGIYPEQLDVLAPQFIEKIPHDIINGQPLHYHRIDNGKFLLYSVGWNGKDDGGVPDVGGQIFASKAQGDWVWQYPAKN